MSHKGNASKVKHFVAGAALALLVVGAAPSGANYFASLLAQGMPPSGGAPMGGGQGGQMMPPPPSQPSGGSMGGGMQQPPMGGQMGPQMGGQPSTGNFGPQSGSTFGTQPQFGAPTTGNFGPQTAAQGNFGPQMGGQQSQFGGQQGQQFGQMGGAPTFGQQPGQTGAQGNFGGQSQFGNMQQPQMGGAQMGPQTGVKGPSTDSKFQPTGIIDPLFMPGKGSSTDGKFQPTGIVDPAFAPGARDAGSKFGPQTGSETRGSFGPQTGSQGKFGPTAPTTFTQPTFQFNTQSSFQLPAATATAAKKAPVKIDVDLSNVDSEEDANFTDTLKALDAKIKELNKKKLTKAKYLNNVTAIAQKIEEVCQAAELDCEDDTAALVDLITEGNVKDVKKGLSEYFKAVRANYEDAMGGSEE